MNNIDKVIEKIRNMESGISKEQLDDIYATEREFATEAILLRTEASFQQMKILEEQMSRVKELLKPKEVQG